MSKADADVKLTMAEAVATYTAQGWVSVPIVGRSKRPAILGWNQHTVADVDPTAFVGRNIGLSLGAPSHNLLDVDLDCPEAVMVAEFLLPPTGMIHGRAGAPSSHWWYETTDFVPATTRRKDLDGVLVELRGTGGQTVCPPSIHVSGELLTWRSWPPVPAKVTLLELSEAVDDVAAGAALARAHPGDGSRHDYALQVAGFLAHLGYPEDRAQRLVQAVSAVAGDADPKDRAVCVADTYKRFRASGEVSGTPKLAEVVPAAVVDRLREWLGGRGAAAAGVDVVAPAGKASAPAAGSLADRLGPFTKFLQRSKAGKLQPTVVNATLILSRDREFGAPPCEEFGAPVEPGPSLAFDKMRQQEVWRRSPPDGTGLGIPQPGPLADQHLVYVQAWLFRITGVEFKHVLPAVQAAAHECEFNPVTEYLEGLCWDGVPRLSSWLTTYLGAAPTMIHGRLGRWWLIAAVARARKPGCRADYMLVLEGPQGAKKSTALQVLGGDWYSPGTEKIGEKDGMQSLRGVWLIEMAELDAFKKAELATIKKFLTDREDCYRPSYGKFNVKVARRCVFAGTTNDSTYLHDPTGGRRFWPVPVGVVGDIDIPAITRDRDQLFAEAMVAYDADERWWPTEKDENDALKELQDERQEPEAWRDEVVDYLDGRMEVPTLKGSPATVPIVHDQVTVDEILVKVLQFDRSRYGRTEQLRVANLMRSLGWLRSRVTRHGRQSWVYRRPAPGEK